MDNEDYSYDEYMSPMPSYEISRDGEFTALERTHLEDSVNSRPMSQVSSYSGLEDDISPLIQAYTPTQIVQNDAELPSSSNSSGSSMATLTGVELGKRKSQHDSPTPEFTGLRKKPRTTEPETPPVDPHDAPIVIAYDKRYQACFASRNLSFGVQYEISRLISSKAIKNKDKRATPKAKGKEKGKDEHITFQDIKLEQLDQLKGTNQLAAPMVAKIFTKASDTPRVSSAKETAARSPWAELDKEEQALQLDPLAGLGYDAENKRTDWYGGKVHFRATLWVPSDKDDKSPPRLILERAELGPSCRFTRRFGSHNFLTVKLPTKFRFNPKFDLIEYFSRPIVLGDRVYRSFYAKDTNIFLIRTNEIYNGTSIFTDPKCKERLSFMGFLEWYNSLPENNNQTMAKWASRFALGLSNSVVGPKLMKWNILPEDDILSTNKESDMTDGCGYINSAGLRQAQHEYNWNTFPTALQVRIAGNKGLLTRHPTDDSEEPRVWIRPSQIKIKYPGEYLDPAMLSIDILRSSHMQSPSHVSPQTLTNLAENGVREDVFYKFIDIGMEAITKDLMNLDESPQAIANLWTAVDRAGGVWAARRAREEAGEARVRGFQTHERDSAEDEMQDGEAFSVAASKEQSVAWFPDEISGCPSSLEETILLDSGFKPRECPVLRAKLKEVITKAVMMYVRNYKVEIPCSGTAWMIPDPTGTLEEGQVHIKSSSRNLLTTDMKSKTDIVLGPVVITRYPCMLPTDTQKFVAFESSALRDYVDVIVFSTKGLRRPADLLAGGDYDGDKGLFIWDHDVVNSFKPADLDYATQPANMMGNFEKETEKVSDFLAQNLSPAAKQRKIQRYLLGSLQDSSLVGMYSGYHLNATYSLGYSHPETIRLAYMFSLILDSSKSGLRVRPAVLSVDKKKWGKRPPSWKETDDEKKKFQLKGSNEVNIVRPAGLQRFIMDGICKHAQKRAEAMRKTIDVSFGESPNDKMLDAHLAAPWKEAITQAEAEKQVRTENAQAVIDHLLNSDDPANVAAAQALKDSIALKVTALKIIASHVRASYTQSKVKFSEGFTNLPIEVRQDILRAMSADFAARPTPAEINHVFDADTIAKLRASFAYIHDAKSSKSRGWSRFPWNVTARDLCDIKVHALGHKPMSQTFYDFVRARHNFS